ncbi:E3 ubiquitin-protein ligase HECTD3 isoform X1 [Vulpes lagopus]|uniref:E3 ubiquitin-protein ligase HECTD3 isoform X1 n=1 Tax=Vulpes lagopus TaxID=494514 RepID=UPI001BC9B6E9|nr:E3 ubiquitin-protein ligase HECTD3 isoform X1 [Vulpes lagopus]
MAGPGPGAALECPRQLLGRVRFLAEAAQSLRAGRPLPAALAFVPREVLYKLYKDPAGPSRVLLPVWEAEGLGLRVGASGPAPGTGSGPLRAARDSIELRRGACVRTTGEELCNGHGLWVKLTKEQLAEHLSDCGLNEGWLLVCRPAEGGARLVPIDTPDHLQRQQQLFGVDYRPVLRWEQVVDLTYSHRLGSRPRPAEAYTEAVQRLLYVPPTWTYECDEDLIHFLYDHLGKEDENLGSVKQYVESIDVSSYTEEFNVSCLTDSNADTYWESDGSQCQHWVRLTMKKGTIVKKLLLTVDTTDDNFMPKRVVIYGGEGDNLKKLSDVSIDETLIGDVCVLEDMTVHLPVIEIRIVECRDDGIDVRLRGIKIKSSRQRELGLNADLFQPTSLVRYPRLEGTDPEVLYRRAVLLQRFIKILDSVLYHLVPAWDHTLGTFSAIKQVKQFLLLSRQRPGLVAQCLRDSESSKPSFMPRLYINRRLAMEHRACPLRDPACKNAVFTQVYEGLKPSDKYEKPLDYRWPMRYDQWWECKFIAEGIIDQGGGFRDSLADMSEELCPSSADTPVPLPFFVRTANQGNGTGEARDMYVPNPSCRDFAKYEWIGQLMGAALRGKEFLVLALPGFVWKQLSGEEVSWSKDFPAVDSVLVKLLEVMEGMDKETFEFKFGKELTFTTVLSDQQVVELIPGGAGIVVGYEDRSRFIQLVQKTRLEESKEQVAAMQAGLLKVVPQAVLDLLTWQELEKKVCGDPEVTVDALRKLTRFEDFEPSDTRVQYFWEALNNFTNVWPQISFFIQRIGAASCASSLAAAVCPHGSTSIPTNWATKPQMRCLSLPLVPAHSSYRIMPVPSCARRSSAMQHTTAWPSTPT